MKSLLTIILLVTLTSTFGQQFRETITKELTFERKGSENALMIANVNGSVTVTGHDSDNVVVEMTRSIRGKTDARLEKGKEQVQLGVIDRADTLIVYVKDGCNSFGKRTSRRSNGSFLKGWGYEWSNCDRDCRLEYDYTTDFVVKVPRHVNLLASTINEGDIEVSQVNGKVDASNINGSIKLLNLVREAEASTINGDVDIEYATNPSSDCRFYTLNGDINALFNKGLAATLAFESFNGEFFTNIDRIETLPVQVTKSAKGEGVRFKVNGNRYKVGNGGALLDFETFNGDVYLKEKN